VIIEVLEKNAPAILHTVVKIVNASIVKIKIPLGHGKPKVKRRKRKLRRLLNAHDIIFV
jgi:hypothetical protein